MMEADIAYLGVLPVLQTEVNQGELRTMMTIINTLYNLETTL